MDQPSLHRLLRLMKLISSNLNFTVDELAEKLDTTDRTILPLF